MIVEYIRYVVPGAQHAPFLEAYEATSADLREMKHYRIQAQGASEAPP